MLSIAIVCMCVCAARKTNCMAIESEGLHFRWETGDGKKERWRVCVWVCTIDCLNQKFPLDILFAMWTLNTMCSVGKIGISYIFHLTHDQTSSTNRHRKMPAKCEREANSSRENAGERRKKSNAEEIVRLNHRQRRRKTYQRNWNEDRE